MLQNWHFQQDLEPSTERKVLPWILAFRVLNCIGFTPICQLDRIRPKLEMSPQAPITSSVQKGSVLWPLLYLIYIKNIPAVIKASVADKQKQEGQPETSERTNRNRKGNKKRQSRQTETQISWHQHCHYWFSEIVHIWKARGQKNKQNI